MSTKSVTRSFTLAVLALVAAPLSTHAAGLNDPTCVPSAAHPTPVVLVHGQGGNVAMFEQFGMVDALVAAGYCVYGIDYGRDGSGQNGRAHLAVSGDQILAFIEQVRQRTGAAQVDVISHSAGTGVLANIILAKRRGTLIRRAVSFGGLHHPYAHAGAADADAHLFLPALLATVRELLPGITIPQLVRLYASAGGPLFGLDPGLATSAFVADLFDPAYWTALHGGLSEPPGTYIVTGVNARTLATRDADPAVCYTNIVGVGDFVTGTAAGFQDPAPNVDNFLLVTLSDHSQILGDGIARAKLLATLAAPCVVPSAGGDPDDAGGGEPDDGDDDGAGPGGAPGDGAGDGDVLGGCAVGTGGPGSLALIVAGLALVAARRRRA